MEDLKMKEDRRIKDVLVNANKYDDVINLVNHIINDTSPNYPVKLFRAHHGRYLMSLDGASVRTEAIMLLDILKADDSVLKTVCEAQLDDLKRYVRDTCHMILYNYANQISHRKQPSIKETTAIRTWNVLTNLFDQSDLWNEDDKEGYYIPDGWHKLKNE